jgi:transposase-like protein
MQLRPKSFSREPCGLLVIPPRVINVDGNPSYPKVIMELKREQKFGCRCRCRTCPYLNNIVEQDRAIKRRVNASQDN